MTGGYRTLRRPEQPASIRRSAADLAAQAKSRGQFDKLFRSAKAEMNASADVALDNALAMAKRIGDARRLAVSQELAKFRAENRANFAKVMEIGRRIEDLQRRLATVEKSQSAERVGRCGTLTAFAPTADDRLEKMRATLGALPRAELAKLMPNGEL